MTEGAGLGDERSAAVAAPVLTFEKSVDQLAAERDLSHYFTAEPRRGLAHGHCHRKARAWPGVTDADAAVLRDALRERWP